MLPQHHYSTPSQSLLHYKDKICLEMSSYFLFQNIPTHARYSNYILHLVTDKRHILCAFHRILTHVRVYLIASCLIVNYKVWWHEEDGSWDVEVIFTQLFGRFKKKRLGIAQSRCKWNYHASMFR